MPTTANVLDQATAERAGHCSVRSHRAPSSLRGDCHGALWRVRRPAVRRVRGHHARQRVHDFIGKLRLAERPARRKSWSDNGLRIDQDRTFFRALWFRGKGMFLPLSLPRPGSAPVQGTRTTTPLGLGTIQLVCCGHVSKKRMSGFPSGGLPGPPGHECDFLEILATVKRCAPGLMGTVNAHVRCQPISQTRYHWFARRRTDAERSVQ